MADVQSAKEEVIVELVDQCRLNQHRVMQLVNVSSYVVYLSASWFLFES